MANTMHSDTRLGYVHLTVTSLERALTFYQGLGFKLHHRNGDATFLGAGGADLVALTENTKAQQTRGMTGLYHLAILVPSRLEFAQSLKRVAQTGVPTQGFADHGVSRSICQTPMATESKSIVIAPAANGATSMVCYK